MFSNLALIGYSTIVTAVALSDLFSQTSLPLLPSPGAPMLLILQISSAFLEDTYEFSLDPDKDDPLARLEDMNRDRKDEIASLTRLVDNIRSNINVQVEKSPLVAAWTTTQQSQHGPKVWTKQLIQCPELGFNFNGTTKFTCTQVNNSNCTWLLPVLATAGRIV